MSTDTNAWDDFTVDRLDDYIDEHSLDVDKGLNKADKLAAIQAIGGHAEPQTAVATEELVYVGEPGRFLGDGRPLDPGKHVWASPDDSHNADLIEQGLLVSAPPTPKESDA